MTEITATEITATEILQAKITALYHCTKTSPRYKTKGK